MGTGARELHGVFQDEVALGLQLQCNACKLKRHELHGDDLTTSEIPPQHIDNQRRNEKTNVPQCGAASYCCATTSSAYWKSWPHWKIPGELAMHTWTLVMMLMCAHQAAFPSFSIDVG